MANFRRGECLPFSDRVWSKVNKTETCWLWMGHIGTAGYARLARSGGRKNGRILVHRWTYEQAKGPIAEGLEIDHLCRVRHCVNPDHLEAVTPQVNQHRGFSVSGINARKTHCPRGHAYEGNNSYWRTENKRSCKLCAMAHAQCYRADNMARGLTSKGRTPDHSRYARHATCKYGHEFTPENTAWKTKDGYRYQSCRTCMKGYR